MICESDSGGYNRFAMDEVFFATGLESVAKRYGIRTVNMSHVPSRPICSRYGLRRFNVPMPTCLLDKTDVFHYYARAEGPLQHRGESRAKKPMGVIQQPELRLKLHPYFKK